MSKVVLIGCGFVGMSYAYALVNQVTKVNELILIDIDKEKSIGEAMDLNHSLALSPTKINIKSGSYEDVNGADIVVIAAGRNQEVGETRLDLLNKNKEVFKVIIDECLKYKFDGIFLVATNPLDIMTYMTYKLSGFDKKRVIGSGTTLDTSRLRYLVGEKLNIDTKNVHAYVIGEHGDSELVAFSSAYVGNNKLSKYMNKDEMDKIEDDVRNAAYEIIKRKKATYYGIGMCLAFITNSILSDKNNILTLSVYDEKSDIYIGLPAIVNKDGIREVLDIDLSEQEQKALDKSKETIKEYIDKLNL